MLSSYSNLGKKVDHRCFFTPPPASNGVKPIWLLPHLTRFKPVCSCLGLFSLFGPVWPSLAPSGLVRAHLALFCPVVPHLALVGLIWPYLASFGLVWPRLAQCVPVWFCLILLYPVWSRFHCFYLIWSSLTQFVLLWPCLNPSDLLLLHLIPFRSVYPCLNQFDPIDIIMVACLT